YRKNREISYYADVLCVTPKYLSEISKKVSGYPAAYWIARYTSLDIAHLLRSRHLSLSEICDMFGFSSYAYFCRYIKKHLGASPSDFTE
ncbi:MAG: helix-turn-helix domain-containing protein, partial [Muribaculaceae bacterium]